jgi:phage shock protein PspC (stress-responsive transcriptional regulator)
VFDLSAGPLGALAMFVIIVIGAVAAAVAAYAIALLISPGRTSRD